MARAEAYLSTKWHPDPCSRLVTIDMGRKLGRRLCPHFGEEELGRHLTQCRLSRGLPPYQVASWSMQPFGHNGHGPKIGGLPACQVSSWSVQPFGHNTPTLQTGQDRQTERQWSDSIGRTALKTVAQNALRSTQFTSSVFSEDVIVK